MLWEDIIKIIFLKINKIETRKAKQPKVGTYREKRENPNY